MVVNDEDHSWLDTTDQKLILFSRMVVYSYRTLVLHIFHPFDFAKGGKKKSGWVSSRKEKDTLMRPFKWYFSSLKMCRIIVEMFTHWKCPVKSRFFFRLIRNKLWKPFQVLRTMNLVLIEHGPRKMFFLLFSLSFFSRTWFIDFVDFLFHI